MNISISDRRNFIVRWANILDRCDNPKNPSYHRYGGRGIGVCPSWYDYRKFAEDLPDGYFPKADIDRIDNNIGYCKGNVRWVTRSENSKNKSNNRNITLNGETLCTSDWARRIGINISSLIERLDRWSVEDALTKPKGSRLYNRWDGHSKPPEKAKKRMKLYLFEGKEYTMGELSKMSGIQPRLLRKRINERGWDVAKAVATPPQ